MIESGAIEIGLQKKRQGSGRKRIGQMAKADKKEGRLAVLDIGFFSPDCKCHDYVTSSELASVFLQISNINNNGIIISGQIMDSKSSRFWQPKSSPRRDEWMALCLPVTKMPFFFSSVLTLAWGHTLKQSYSYTSQRTPRYRNEVYDSESLLRHKCSRTNDCFSL